MGIYGDEKCVGRGTRNTTMLVLLAAMSAVRGDVGTIPPACNGTTRFDGMTFLTGNTTVVYESRDPTMFTVRFWNDTTPFRTYGACGGGYVMDPVAVQLFASTAALLLLDDGPSVTLETVFDFFDFELACARGDDPAPMVFPLVGEDLLVCNTTTRSSVEAGVMNMTALVPGWTPGGCVELPEMRFGGESEPWRSQSYFRCASATTGTEETEDVETGDSGRLSGGAVAGIVAGGVVVVAVAMIWERRNQARVGSEVSLMGTAAR